MKRYSTKFIIRVMTLCSVISVLALNTAEASEVGFQTDENENMVIVQPLFDYVSVPDSISSLQDRTNYLVTNFWNPMDFKRKDALDQNALDHAFSVYAAGMPYADREVTLKSVDELVKKLKKNPLLLLQFTKAAEESLYGPRAEIWIDEVYLKFLNAVTDCKKISKIRRLRYADQRKRLESSMTGAVIPAFKFEDMLGQSQNFRPRCKVNIIEFGNPECEECNNARILMEVDLDFRKMAEAGDASMSFILIEEDEDNMMREGMKRYPETWTVGYNPDLSESLDIRETPCFYVVDGEGKILGKNLGARRAIALAQSVLSAM